LRHQEPAGSLCGGPHDVVIPPGEVLSGNRVDIVYEVGEELDELMRQILVELDPHRTRASATGRSLRLVAFHLLSEVAAALGRRSGGRQTTHPLDGGLVSPLVMYERPPE